jgi:hypothetical protein
MVLLRLGDALAAAQRRDGQAGAEPVALLVAERRGVEAQTAAEALAGAAAAVAVGGLLAACGSSDTTATATPAAATSSASSPAQGTAPALGKTVTDAAADKAKAAALAKYRGTVERVEQLADGSTSCM